MKLIQFLIFSFLTIVLCACQQPSKPSNTIKIGAMAGPEIQLLEVAKRIAKNKYGLNIEIVQFNDYVMPNAALNDGSIDANMFQHLPFFQQAIQAHHYKIVDIGKTFIYPMGIYSQKITNLHQLPNKAIVAIPNDPSNETRALLLLQQAGLLVLKMDANNANNLSLLDIVNNPKQLQIKELNAAQLPRALADVDIAAINTNYAIPAGLKLAQAIFTEDANSPYANIVAIRIADKDKPQYQQLMKSLQSPEVLAEAKKIFNDSAIPAWVRRE